MTIDVTFDFRTDTPDYPRCDPDTHSPTLRRYQRLLWSKPLPSGPTFDLSEQRYYLYHCSELGEFTLSSDAVMQTFIRWPVALQPVRVQDPPQVHEAFFTIAYTIGAMMIWPANKIDGRLTINQDRGFRRWDIADRFDLTVECVRRHYLGRSSPLANTLSRYADFFDLFGDFRGFVDFFLLDDLVADDGSVRFFMPFDDFRPEPGGSAIPKDVDTYREYRRRSIEFIDIAPASSLTSSIWPISTPS
jgi:hypothetical protein